MLKTTLSLMRDKPKRCPVRALKKRLRSSDNVELLAPPAARGMRRDILGAAKSVCESCPFVDRC